MALIVLCFASAGSRVSLTGGLYAYIEVEFGPAVGFVCGVLYWLMALFAVASVASAFAASVGVLWPAAETTAGRAVVLLALFALLASVNVRGVNPGAGLVEIVTAAKLVPLLVLVGVGVWFMHADYLQWTSVPPISQVGRTAMVLIYAFFGVEIALAPSGEIRDPARTIPRALFLALALTTTLYLAIQTVAQGLLGPSMAGYSAAPLAEAAARVLGQSGRLLVLDGAMCAWAECHSRCRVDLACRFSPEPSSSGCCLRRHGGNSPSRQPCCSSRSGFMCFAEGFVVNVPPQPARRRSQTSTHRRVDDRDSWRLVEARQSLVRNHAEAPARGLSRDSRQPARSGDSRRAILSLASRRTRARRHRRRLPPPGGHAGHCGRGGEDRREGAVAANRDRQRGCGEPRERRPARRRDGRVHRRVPFVVAGSSEGYSALISRSSLVTSVSS